MLRKLLFIRTLLGFAFFAALLSGPATAWDSHLAQHSAAPVTIDVHHHHDDEGVMHNVEADTDPEQQRDGERGHTHMPSGSATISAVLSDALSPAVRYSVEQPLVGRTSLISHGRLTPPQKRPPRLI